MPDGPRILDAMNILRGILASQLAAERKFLRSEQ